MGCACLAALAGTALADFPQTAPDDPSYDVAEEGPPTTCATTPVSAELKYLYSFMPRCTPLATDPEDASGMSVDRAWRRFTTGNPDTVIAYVEGGINWHDSSIEELVDRVFLNRGELPAPTTPRDDGVLNARDYADTDDVNGNGLVDAEDIIARFSDGVDDDGNGYTDDISGWDFYSDQNDPATIDSAYDHANNQMEQAVAEGDNGYAEIGICPDCMVLPIKGGAEALDRTDDLAESWLYASDVGADVIVSTTADLGYSSFMRDAVEHVWREGAVMVESSNDFDSTDHQGGMFHPHVLPGNGMVANTHTSLSQAQDAALAVNAATRSYRERSGYSSWGTHNVFTAATNGGTTSEATPTVGGVMAIVLAYGKEAARQGLIERPLTNAEAIQVVRETASDVNDPALGWPNGPGWDLQYGYGRPNVFEAMQAIHAGEVPPVGWINSPRWYALFDPTRDDRVAVRGNVSALRSQSFRYEVGFAPGAEPAESDFMTAGSGSGTGSFNGRLGTIDLDQVPQSFWSRAHELSDTKTLETTERYTVTIRLRVRDAQGRVAEDRRSIAVVHDPSWAPRFPRRIGPGGEAQPALVDLQGTGRLAIVFGDSDGRLHALDGRSGRELPGFPVLTLPTEVEVEHRDVDPGHEPLLTGPAVGDLDGDGTLEIVTSSTTGRVYAWDDRGRALDGWPKTVDAGVRRPPIPRPQRPFTRDPVQGATAPPVLYDLDGDGDLEVVQAGWDGHLHAWHDDGSRLDGWPVEVTLPASHEQPPGRPVLGADHKLDTPPAIGDIDGDSEPELVLRSQYGDMVGGGLQPGHVSHLHAYEANGTPVEGFPVEAQGLFGYWGSAQEFITEGINMPSLADVDGDGDDEIAFAPAIFSPTVLYDGDGSIRTIYGPVPDAALDIVTGEADADTILGLIDGDLPGDPLPVNFTTFGGFGRFGPGGQLAYVAPATGGTSVIAGLLVPGSGHAIKNYETVYNGLTGVPMPGFPSELQGLDFVGGPAIADVTGDRQTEVINAADSSALQAFEADGSQAPGFPKFTTGWIVFAPAVGDLDSDGRSEIVAATREGYLFVWRTDGDPLGNQESWRTSRDEHHTMAYGNDTRPPGILRKARQRPGRVTFRAPGDDWYAGRAEHYRVALDGCGPGGPSETRSFRAGVAGGGRERLRVPDGMRALRIWAVDDAGNRGPAAEVAGGC